MNDEQYRDHCLSLLSEFAATMTQRTAALAEDDSLRQLAASFAALAAGEGNLYEDTPGLISRLFTTYTDFAPTFPRQLLWFFGGDCLHYMPDEEIAVFQALEDQRLEAAATGERFDPLAARAKLLKLQ
mgnify:CR=1 FL=1|tara:strand:- start:191521 stop:191904 length:384 start_codon:yes stop_codon:yes gene_type:complete